ncbi:gliding motility-associated C-terminal domain-containing protein [Zobellia uliginosa]|uniref:T9SS type B sorting domain-containing protein n=1 Tax=Zobellia uliginosa TaxID=143224 RepID=UPI0026E1644E|nr:gliding motility-associated C-terminal domain-containing protein [Zobellia uliginosa]MDO6518815.1 gliding motility-associated C-terminal domain-containing protein [Zobellia uliginosa]
MRVPRKGNPHFFGEYLRCHSFLVLLFLFMGQSLWAQPSNDNRANAMPLSLNTCSADAAYTTLNATPDGSSGSCWASGPNANVWFSFVASATGTVQINLDRGTIAGDMTGDLRYAMMALWDATGTTEIACSVFNDVSDDISILASGLTPGDTYLFSVDRHYGTPSGAETFKLCLSDTPTNDYLEGAINIDSFMNGCSGDAIFSTLGATADRNGGSCWYTGPHRNVWFEVTAPATGNIEVKLDRGDEKGTLQTAYLALWDSTGTIELGCNSHRVGRHYDDISLLATGLTPGDTYYVSVDNRYIHALDTFSLCLSDQATNDYYQGATDITGLIGTCSPDAAYTTLGATFDKNTASCWSDLVNHNKWFSFVAPPSGKIDIRMDRGGVKGTLRHAYMALWENDGLTEMACTTYSDPEDDLRIRHWGLTPGETYYLTVDNRYITTTDTFTLCLDALNGPDTDGDGVGDVVDLDDDNDGILDTTEGCENTNLSGTVGMGNPITDTTYALVGTDVSYTVNKAASTNMYAYDTGLNGHGIRIEGQGGDTGSLTSTYGTPIENVFFKMTDFDNGTQYTIEVYDENNVMYDLDVEGLVLVGSGITQTGNTFVAGSFDSDGNDPADDVNGAIYFYFERPVSRIVLNFVHSSNTSTRFIQPTFCLADFDNDGISDHKDLDSDGDGIPDNVEAQSTQAYQAPNPDDEATYRANNGVNSAYLGGVSPVNTDTTDNPDYLDLDSDNEGGNDTMEAGITLANNDVDDDGLDDAIDTDLTGYADPGGTIDDPTIGSVQLPDEDHDVHSGGDVDFRDATDDRPDNDGDGIADEVDLDDDNDGILDTDENVCAHIVTGQNVRSNVNTLQNSNAVLEAGVKYVLDIQNVSAAGILTGEAVDGPFAGQTINIYLTNTTSGGATLNGVTAVYNSDFTYHPANSAATGGLVNSGFYVFYGIVDANANGTYEDGVDELLGPVDPLVPGSIPIATTSGPLYFYYNDGIYGDNLASVDYGVKVENCDTDGDGIPNIFDLDSDNDGIFDGVEAGHGQVDADTDGRIDGTAVDFGNNGLFNGIESDDTQGATITYTLAESPDDTDSIPNYLDLDSDGDGLPDNVEAQTTAAYLAPNGTVDANGVDKAYPSGLVPTNTDGTDNPDYLDLDSDNEAGDDTTEARIVRNGLDVDNDGLDDALDADTSGYTDPGGTIDNPLTGPLVLPDGDSDAGSGGDVDFRDTTDDRPDNDNDGVVDAEDLDDDNDGILDTDEGCGNFIINGSFEQDNFTDATAFPDGFTGANGTFIGTTYNTNSLTGWNYTQNLDGWVNGGSFGAGTFAPAIDGSQYLDLVGNNNVTGGVSNEITQEVTLVQGESYTFSFYWGEDIAHLNGQIVTLDFDIIDADGVPILDETLTTIATGEVGGLVGPKKWFYEERTFVASTDEITVRFSAQPFATNASSGAALDLVTLKYSTPTECIDTDNDGIPDAFDLDSDNDGIYDADEAGHGAAHSNGVLTGTVGADGIPDSVQDDPDRRTVNYTVLDSDTDGSIDSQELDADNDGCFDVVEAGFTDGDADGLLGSSTLTVDANGLVTTGSDGYTVPQDRNGNGIPEYREATLSPVINTQPSESSVCSGETASFSVVATDVDQYQWQMFDGSLWADLTDGGLYSGTDTHTLEIANTTIGENGNRYRVVVSNSLRVCSVLNSDEAILNVETTPSISIGDASEVEGGSIVFPVTLSSMGCLAQDITLTFTFTDGTADTADYTNNTVQITIPAGSLTGEVNVPTTQDEILEDDETFTISILSVDAGNVADFSDTAIGTILDDDFTDLDSDNDGILDSVEDLNADGDNDPSTNPTDSDGDSLPDYLDIDSDNDGIPDNVEAQTTAGYIAPSLVDANNNGLDDAYENGTDLGLYPVNTDGTDQPDYLDLDSDNDHVPDAVEAHDRDHDGRADVSFIGSDKDDDGLDDGYEGSETIDDDVNDEMDSPFDSLPNADGDDELDYRDTDDDNDGIPTQDEDTNGDGNYANDDQNDNGVPDYLEEPYIEVVVYNVVTPNGDGAHDTLTITGLDVRPNNNIQIYNRWGILIFSTESYGTRNNYFEGYSTARLTSGKEEKLPSGTYFYILNYEDTTGEHKTLSGYIYLN